jgi:hypothetical protein
MNKLASSTHSHESSTHERAIEALAQEAHVPIEQVAQLYERELAVLTVGARITGFLSILTIRKVRDLLRQHSHPARAQAASVPREVDARAQAQAAPPDRTVLSSV